jgi:hypothetical protein
MVSVPENTPLVAGVNETDGGVATFGGSVSIISERSPRVSLLLAPSVRVNEMPTVDVIGFSDTGILWLSILGRYVTGLPPSTLYVFRPDGSVTPVILRIPVVDRVCPAAVYEEPRIA